MGNVAGNVISGNFGAGVRISGDLATGNLIQGDVIGTDVSGKTALPNFQEGVVLESAGNTVGGSTAGAGSLISSNLRGVLISGPAAAGNLVAGNFIGTDGSGTYNLGNSFEGVRIDAASGNTIGGQVAAARNLISGNNVGVLIVGATAIDNLVLGNYIGTNVTGLVNLGNALEGVRIEGAPGNTIGGTSPAATNVISGNQWGVTITDLTATSNVVQGNLIGTGADGLTPLGNEVNGVLVQNAAANNLIGGLASGQGNTIAFNLEDGVKIEGVSSTGNGILSNRIFANGGLGIDLVAPSGSGNVSQGPNNLQSAPVLDTLLITSTGVTVGGTLNSTPNTSFLIQFFLDAPGNSSSDGQLLGATTVTTDGNGNARFSVALAVTLTAGEGIRATATDPNNNTSEFSTVIINQPAAMQFSMASYAVSATAGLAVITVVRAGGGGVVTVAYAAGGGTATPGTDYIPVSGTLTFGLGITVQNFTVPIIADPLLENDKTVNLVLSKPTGGATLGVPSSAVLTIGPEHRDLRPPTVQGVRLTTNRHRIVTGLVVTFSKQLNPTTATNLLNYGYSVRTAGRDHVFGTRDDLIIPITRAVYDSTALSVTLSFGRGIHPPTPFEFAINESTAVPGGWNWRVGLGRESSAGEPEQRARQSLSCHSQREGGRDHPRCRRAISARPASIAAVDSVLEMGKISGHWAARDTGEHRGRMIGHRR